MASIVPGNRALLVDTSVWIAIFRPRPQLSLEQVVGDVDRVVTCLPVIQEVLQGFGDERAFRIARTGMYALPCVQSPLSRHVVHDAIDLYRSARRAGVTVRSNVDCLIAVCAMRHDLLVVHCDRDFANLATVARLDELNLSSSVMSRV